MGIGMMRRHYGNEEDSATVHLAPQPIQPDEEGGVVAIGDEPGTAPTPTSADAPERNLEEAPASEDAPEAPDANEKGASADQHGDPDHTVDPEGHPVDHAIVADHMEAKGEHPHERAAPVGVELPKRNSSRAVWADYAEKVGVAVADTEGRDDIAARFLDEK